MQSGERSVKLPPLLAEAIDKLIKERKGEYGVPEFRSRADFVAKACKRFIQELEKGRQR